MPTISLCMIVKNEEAVLARCLDSVADLMDEIIIVDTGSDDRTKAIAAQYTDRVYDFAWCGDFAAARNFAFSFATQEYIYAPDADEYLDPVNRKRFAQLKAALLPEIEIVQMYYVTPETYNTVQNCKKELRPKLFKRLRTFCWTDPVHETVRTAPVVYDSDIEIVHRPHASHAKRDLALFAAAFARDGVLSEKIARMYAKELYKCGDAEDLQTAVPFFAQHYEACGDAESAAVLARAARLRADTDTFFAYCLKNIAKEPCAEICHELGAYYDAHENPKEASLWYYNAAFETASVLDLETTGRKTLAALCSCCRRLAAQEQEPDARQALLAKADDYEKQAADWTLPDTL